MDQIIAVDYKLSVMIQAAFMSSLAMVLIYLIVRVKHTILPLEGSKSSFIVVVVSIKINQIDQSSQSPPLKRGASHAAQVGSVRAGAAICLLAPLAGLGMIFIHYCLPRCIILQPSLKCIR